MKKSLTSSLKKRSLDISLQHKNEASYKFSKKKKLLHLAENMAGGERVKLFILYRQQCFKLSDFVHNPFLQRQGDFCQKKKKKKKKMLFRKFCS